MSQVIPCAPLPAWFAIAGRAKKRLSNGAGYVLLPALILLICLPGMAQENNISERVTKASEGQVRITLRGNTPPLARAEFDRGLAPDDQPMRRMLLLLKRSPGQERALDKLLVEQQDRSSSIYHHWLTPEQFGGQFGPAQSDVQTVTDWLTSQGFQIDRIAAGRTVIEFSGNAGEVRSSLGTEIHRYSVHGKSYWSNARDPQIPAALARQVRGVVSLNNFPRKPLLRTVGTFARSKETGKVEPLFTLSFNGSTYYVLGPWDFSTVYNVSPLWQAGIDGTGQTIAIVGETNINAADDQSFRSMWDLPANNAQVILNGPDPGMVPGDEGEADADTQWAGAVAKGATIDLVVSESTETTAGIDLSALYIIDNNIAPIMSESYGGCEQDVGAAGNAFYNALWQQGSAQGITVIVAAGDSGSDVCDYGKSTGPQYATSGLSVSGFASTPFNVAVGGTDFNDVGSFPTYWNSTNNSSTQSSAKSYIPERTWNNSCASAGITGCVGGNGGSGEYNVGGSGGPSSCSLFDGSGNCASGYSKPAWQTGTGVPGDGARDLPDVSLFAADGTSSNSFYPVCEEDVIGYSCSFNGFLGVGGTSLSAPAFAGIMALVVQKTGERQGNANYVLYPLAAQSGASCASNTAAVGNASCVFYDTVTGNNSVACLGGTPNCGKTSGGYGVLVDPANPTLPAWITTPGYDRATGLGSVNAANLVNEWSSVSFSSTTTALSLSTTPPTSPITVVHGQPVNFNINVTAKSGTPSGAVSLLGGSSASKLGIDSATLSSGAVSGSTVFLPGGNYGVTAHYAGDGTFGASDSTPPVPVTVTPEASATKVGLITFDYTTGAETSSNATTASYGSPYILRVDVTNGSGNLCAPQGLSFAYACPTGKVALTDNGGPLDLGNYSLNSQGYTEDQPIQLPAGEYAIVANYAGDSSYKPSTAPADTITITPGTTTTTLSGLPSTTLAGSNINFQVRVDTQSSGVGPSEPPQVFNGNTQISYGGDIVGFNGSASGPAYLLATLGTGLSAGNASITAKYPGDNNYAPSASAPVAVTVTDFSLAVSPTSLNIPTPGQSGSAIIAVTPLYGFTGTITFSCFGVTVGQGIACTFSPQSVTFTSSSPASATLTIATTAPTSAVRRASHSRLFPGSGMRPFTGWAAAAFLLLAILMSAAGTKRRETVRLLFAATLVAGFWAACGGGGGGGGGGPSPAPSVALTPNSLTFSQQTVGTASVPLTVILRNAGTGNLNGTYVSLDGADAQDFSQWGNCVGVISPGGACTTFVSFAPRFARSRTANLVITNSAADSPQTVSLTGTGYSPPTTAGIYYIGVNAAASDAGGTDNHYQTIAVNVQ